MEQYAADDYVKSFAGVAATRGTYSVSGNTLTRKVVASVDPTVAGSEVRGEFTVAGDSITLRGTSSRGIRFESVFSKLKPLSTAPK